MHDFNIELFKYRIRLFVELIIVAFVCISAWSIVSERRTVIASAERNVAGYVQALAEHSESAFAESDRVLRDLLHDMRLERGGKSLDPRELFLELRRQAADSPQIGAIFLVNKDGIMYSNSGEYPPRQISVADREYFRFYRQHPDAELTLSKPVLSRLVNRWRFNLMRPINYPAEPFAGIAAIAFEVSYFQSFFGSASLGSNGRIALIRNDGAPLVCEPMIQKVYEQDLAGSLLFKEKLVASSSGVYHVDKSIFDGSPRIVAFRRLKRFPVVAMVSVSEKEVLAPWERKALQQVALTMGVCLVLGFLTFLILRHLDRLKLALAMVEGQQEQLRVKAALMDAANDAILQIDPQGRLIQFNQALCQMTGYAAEELSRFKLADITAGPLSPDYDSLKNEPHTYDSAFLAKDGTQVPVEVHALVMARESRPLVLNIARDITQRKQSEEREEGRLKILEAMAKGGFLSELLDSIVRFVEKESPGALCSLLVYDEAKRCLRHAAAPSLPAAYNGALDGMPVGEGEGIFGSGSFLSRRVTVPDTAADLRWRDFRPVGDAGLRSCWFEPVLASDGKPLALLGVYHREPKSPRTEELALIESAAHLASLAIERVRADDGRKQLEAQLIHVQKIEAIGQLAAGVAHDFNNLLTPILVYSGLLKTSLAGDEAQAKKAEGITSAALKAKELTQKLLSFGRKQMLRKEVLDLNEVVLSFQEIVARTVRESIVLRLELCPESVEVNADRGQIEQIILNLAVNAQDAIKGNGTITATTRRVVVDKTFAKSRPGLKPGPYALLSFADDGCGMNEETLQHIFEPFFTTKPVGQGTGLGLATVYGLVKQHDGLVEVRSHLGEGTTFDIYLPAAAGAEQPATPSPVPVAGQVKVGQTVLVVEDNEMVREMAVDLLRSAGYRVLFAEDPLQARSMVGDGKERIDLLVTDVVMPQMNGPELYALLVKDRPGLPVLYMTGYADDLATRNLAIGSSDDFLRKPFTSELFLESVGRKLAPPQ